MLQMLRKRLRNEDEGFTLIELMVVVLIIAILLAIAIPTFLGARSRAQNRAAESNLNTALTASKTGFTDNQAYYSTTSIGSVQSIEPSIAFTTAAPAAGTNQVEYSTTDSNAAVCLLDKAANGNMYGIFDETQTSGGTQPAGTYYGYEPSGTALACPTSATTMNTTPGAGWASTTSNASW